MTRYSIAGEPVTGRRFAASIVEDLAVWSITAALNVLVVYWLGQLAFPSLGLVPPTILGAAGITGLALILRRPITLREGGE